MRTRFAHLALLIVAAISTLYATAAFLTGFEADFTVAAIIALLCLGGVFVIEHREHERDRLTHGRDAVWDWRTEEDE